MGDDYSWLTFCFFRFIERFEKRVMVVAVAFDNIPIEAPPFVGEGFERYGFRDRGKALNFVVVDDRD